MKKKKSSKSAGIPCVVWVILMLALVFTGLSFGIPWLLESDLIFRDNGSTVISIEQVNPDATQVPATGSPVTPDNDPGNLTFQQILIDMNSARQSAGLSPVRINSQLNQAAAVQVAYNASVFQVSHEDAGGHSVDRRIEAQGYAWRNVGENLLSNWSIDGHEVFILWQNSPTHNQNMTNADFTEIGLAYMVTPIGQVYHAMVLARPQ